MDGFIEAIAKGRTGLVFENSLFLPFHLEVLSIWVGKEMSLLSTPDRITDITTGNADVAMREGATFTNIILRRHGDLSRELGNEKGHVILYAAEKGVDLFDPENRYYIRICFGKKAKEITFEIIEDPFDL